MKTFYLPTIRLVVLFITILLTVNPAFSQDSTTVSKNRKNGIKINLTNPMFFGSNNYILGYERTVGKHQSFSLNVGTFSLGQLININTDSIEEIDKNVKSRGLSFSCDYRFYLAKENKYNSPHGIYIGPYFASNSFTRNLTLQANTAAFTGQLDADLLFRVTTLGFQLGYQFVFWDRVTLDMVLFGPGISHYRLKTGLSTSLDADQEQEIFQKINDKLGEIIPGYDRVIEPGTFEETGTKNTTGFGYRYIVMVGFRF